MLDIDVYSDVVCPWCYIGKRRIEAALAARPDLETRLHWRPFQLNPDMPASGMDRQTYLTAKFGGDDKASGIYENIRMVGASCGIPFAFEAIDRTPNTLLAHKMIRRAETHEYQDSLVERLFKGYFLEGEDIGDPAVLIRLAVEGGLPEDAARDCLENDSGESDAVRLEDMRARQLGIQGVPFFILDQQYAISGAQEPEAFHPLFDILSTQERLEASGA